MKKWMSILKMRQLGLNTVATRPVFLTEELVSAREWAAGKKLERVNIRCDTRENFPELGIGISTPFFKDLSLEDAVRVASEILTSRKELFLWFQEPIDDAKLVYNGSFRCDGNEWAFDVNETKGIPQRKMHDVPGLMAFHGTMNIIDLASDRLRAGSSWHGVIRAKHFGYHYDRKFIPTRMQVIEWMYGKGDAALLAQEIGSLRELLGVQETDVPFGVLAKYFFEVRFLLKELFAGGRYAASDGDTLEGYWIELSKFNYSLGDHCAERVFWELRDK